MKLTKFVNLLVIALALGVTATGCKKSPQGVTTLPEGPRRGPGDNTDGKIIGDGPGGPGTGTPQGNPEEWLNAKRDEKIFEAYRVQFDYDSAVIKSSEKSKIAAVADHLKANPAAGVEVEGHCDERGTDQYNYSLGEQRALAAREELIRLGVNGAHVMTKSYGRSRPIDTGHSDESHARNRRDQFVLLTK